MWKLIIPDAGPSLCKGVNDGQSFVGRTGLLGAVFGCRLQNAIDQDPCLGPCCEVALVICAAGAGGGCCEAPRDDMDRLPRADLWHVGGACCRSLGTVSEVAVPGPY